MIANESKRRTLFAVALIVMISVPTAALLIHVTRAQATHGVTIAGFSFNPQNLTIFPGDSIVWENSDPVIHTLWFVFVANGSTYLLSDPIGPSNLWEHTFNDTVELQYFDIDRLWITGFINVTAGVHDVVVTDISASRTIVGEGYNVAVNVTVENQGDFTETFNVTLEASRLNASVVNVNLFGSAVGGWGFTAGSIASPGPAIIVNQGDIVKLALTSTDGFTHNFFVDYNGDTNPSAGEPRSQDFSATANYQFTADTLGTFTYYCQYHKSVMFGTFTVNAPTYVTAEIEKQQTTLNNGTSTTLMFIWDTTGFVKGNYTMSATADIVLGEVDILDNTLVGGWVLVTLAGDVDGDRDVDIFDIVAMAGSYGAVIGDAKYDPVLDIDGDGDIDIFDIVAAAGNYGKSW